MGSTAMAVTERLAQWVRTLGLWVKSHAKLLGTVAGAWVLGCLVMWMAVPGWLQPKLEQTLSTQLGRTVKLGGVEFRPWSLEVILRDVQVASADGSGQQLTVARILVNAELQSLLRMAPVVDEVVLDRPKFRFSHLSEGRYDLDDLISKFSAPSPVDSKPVEFALYNVQIQGGEIDFDDRPVGLKHEIRALELSIPFISTLQSKREVKVRPHLSMQLNGQTVTTLAELLPFANDRKMQAKLQLPKLDLGPYLGYWPKAVAVRPIQGSLSIDLAFDFDPADKASGNDKLVVTGTLGLQQWKWTADAMARSQGKATQTPTWLSWNELTLQFREFNPGARKIGFSRIGLDGLDARPFRDAQGNWLGLRTPEPKTQDKGTSEPWKLELDQLAVKDSRISLPQAGGGSKLVLLDGLAMQGQNLQWPLQDKAGRPAGQLNGHVQWPALQDAGTQVATVSRGTLGFSLTSDAQAPVARLQLQKAQLAGLKGLVPFDPAVKLAGWADGEVDVTLQPPSGKQGWQAKVKVPQLTFEEVQLATPWARPSSQGGTVEGPLAKALPSQIRKLTIKNASMDWPANQIELPVVSIEGPQLEISRDAMGHWSWEKWFQAPSAAVASTPAATTPTWGLRLGELAITSGQLVWWDAAASGVLSKEEVNTQVSTQGKEAAATPSDRTSARLHLKELNARIKALVLNERGLANARSTYELNSQVWAMGRSQAKRGQLNLQGSLEAKETSGSPSILAQASLQTQKLPLHTVDPYIREHVLINLVRADASVRTRLTYRDPGGLPDGATRAEWQVTAEGSLDDLLANSLEPSQELLSWKSLKVASLRASQKRGQPMEVDVGRTRLSDFYARLIIDDKGQINLQQLGRKSTQTVATLTPEKPPAKVRFDGIDMVNGRVNFSDFFIRPNYTANLSELNGYLGGFATAVERDQVQMADLELKGKAQGTADLLIKGQINPLAKPLALNIRGQVTDLELPPLSPYTAKYLGYGIERGKLAVDVGYEIDPKGTLTGKNNFVLNQLTLGEKIEGQGTSGSLSDPQFSVGPLVWRMVLTLIGRAIISPFSLIGGGAGAGDAQASAMAFDPGSDRIQAASRERADSLVKAMVDRPSLKVTLVGQVNSKTEKAAIQRDKLQQLVWAEKMRQQAQPESTERGQIGAQEYPALLKEVYKQSRVKKPRNLVGIPKDLSVPEMEALLQAQFATGDDVLRELALTRAQKIKDLLVSKGLPLDRVFLGQPRIDAELAQVQLQASVD
jgi:uncharacterized protein involved in outer membrane biogenesis